MLVIRKVKFSSSVFANEEHTNKMLGVKNRMRFFQEVYFSSIKNATTKWKYNS
jgi:hypothetical protein